MRNCLNVFLGLILVSCASGRLSKESVDSLLDSIKVVGEGRGRLNMNNQSQVFSFDSILKDKRDWILAAAIPLHGEEVLILHEIADQKTQISTPESLERRISNKKFIQGTRSLIRFVLANDLELKRSCSSTECTVEGETFKISMNEQKLKISRTIGEATFELIAEDLTNSRFQRTNFYLITAHQRLSLELFWK